MAQYLITVVKDPIGGGSVKVGTSSASGVMQEVHKEYPAHSFAPFFKLAI